LRLIAKQCLVQSRPAYGFSPSSPGSPGALRIETTTHARLANIFAAGVSFCQHLVLRLHLPFPQFTTFLSESTEESMRVELFCQNCCNRFVAPPETPALEVLERMIENESWFALGEGETFEDMIFAALTSRGAICCPECYRPVSVSEESLGQMAMGLLAQW
jgi:hypothetical protein